MIFVFGSNEAGIHGAGAAAYAAKYKGAKFGEGYGHFGGSFAIPTKAGSKELGVRETLPLDSIRDYVNLFIAYAYQHPELMFQVTAIGCGLAGLKHEDVAPLFNDAPYNCFFDTEWRPYLTRDESHFWGTF